MPNINELLSWFDARRRFATNQLADLGNTLPQWGAQIGEDATQFQRDQRENRNAMRSVMPEVRAQATTDSVNSLLNMTQPAMTVWHGSPHLFDKFDLSKIGTGEGAQAYGHGLYVAESPGVARDYRTKLSKNDVLFDGQKVAPDRAALDPQSMGLNALKIEPDPIGAAAALRRSVADESLWQRGSQYDHRERYAAAADWLERNANRIKVDKGQLYKVDLPDEHIAKMLDWDKPLSQQSKAVQDVVNAKFDAVNSPAARAEGKTVTQAFPTWSGQDLYDALRMTADPTGKNWQQAAPAASAMMREAGIPGIKYLDAGSRGAGDGTRNFVVFDDRLLNILGRE